MGYTMRLPYTLWLVGSGDGSCPAAIHWQPSYIEQAGVAPSFVLACGKDHFGDFPLNGGWRDANDKQGKFPYTRRLRIKQKWLRRQGLGKAQLTAGGTGILGQSVTHPTASSPSSELGQATIRQSSARLTVGGNVLDIHYRVAGSGPPLFLLHPSPLSSTFMEPLMRRLAGRVTAIAPDTPGFGDSDLVAGEVRDLGPYVQVMMALRSALGLDRVAIYGSATGAQIAVEWAKADAESVSGVILDNAASFTDAERNAIMDGYFPDLRPSADGGHLARAWRTAHDSTLFFPWHQPSAANRLPGPPAPAAAMDFTARGYLRAGPGYEAAYRAAFRNERAERVLPIRAPLVILRWQGSLLKRWMDRFDDHQWGRNVLMAHCGPSLDERWACLEAHLPAVLPQDRTEAEALRLDTGAIRYADAEIGQIRYRMPSGSPSRILIHGLGGSGATVAAELADAQTALVDLPGHGGSATPKVVSVAQCIQAVRQVAAQLGPNPCAVSGVGTAAEGIAEQAADEDGKLTFAPLGLPWHQEAPPDLTPEASGAHLWRGWQWLRRQWLQRNEAPPAPAHLTRLLLDLMRAEAAHQALQQACTPPD